VRHITLEAFAKLNLLLGVMPKTVEGKHLLMTVFTTIDLSDTLSFSFDSAHKRLVTIEVVSAPDVAPLDLPADQNIVFKAVSVLEKSCSRELNGHLNITIDKRIPCEAGLAGGSSDAAATLRALADIWGIDPLGEPVLRAAQSLGADVTFFLYGQCAFMGGSGERLLRRLPQPALDLVLVKPAKGVSTAAAYAAFDADPQPLPSAERLVRLLETPGVSPDVLAEGMANNLCPAACSILPELEALIVELASQKGVYRALLTGSGSTIFGVCEDSQAARRVAEYFRQREYWAKDCATVTTSQSQQS
jgi:4-diphosphocytidyl-2-C-methyl-D-erythritol kinase